MPTEVVVLSDRPMDTEIANRALTELLPDAESFEFAESGLSLYVDLSQTTVISAFPSVEVTIGGAGIDLLVSRPRRHYQYWTDIVIPDHRLAETAREAVERMAQAFSGVVCDRK